MGNEHDWLPEGFEIVDEGKKSQESNSPDWLPEGFEIAEGEAQPEPGVAQPQGEEETTEVTEEVVEPTAEELVESDINNLQNTLYEDKLVAAANERAEKLKAAKEADAQYEEGKKSKAKELEAEEFENETYGGRNTKYKRVEIEQPDGSVKSYSYTDVFKMHGDVDEYVKRWRGKAKIIDNTPVEEVKEKVVVSDPELQAKLDKEAKERKDLIKKLEAEEQARARKLSSLEAKKEYRNEYTSAKVLSKDLASIDANEDRTKKQLGRTIYENISTKIDGSDRNAEDAMVFSTLDEEELINTIEPDGKFHDNARAMLYMNKFFNNDKDLYNNWKQYYNSDGEDYDFEWTKNYVGENVVKNAIREAKAGAQEMFYVNNEYTPQQRRRTSEFMLEDYVGVDELAKAREDHKTEHDRHLENVRAYDDDGKRGELVKVNTAFGSMYVPAGIHSQSKLYGTESFGNDGKTEEGQFSEGSSLSQKELDDLRIKAEEKIIFANEQINEDFNNYEADVSSLEADMKPFVEQVNAASATIQRLEDEGISADSSPAVITEYNNAVQSIKDAQTEMNEAGLQQREEELINTYSILKNRNTELMDKAANFGDVDLAVTGALKNYSNLQRMGLQLEKGFLGSGAEMFGSIVAGLGNAATYVTDKFTDASDEEIQLMYEEAGKLKGLATDYNKELNDSLNEDYIQNIRFDDSSWTNLDTYMGQMFANNSPSILTTLMTLPMGGLGGLSSGAARGTIAYRTAAMRASLQASKMSQGLFFMQGYGSKMADLEIASLNSEQRIADLNSALENAKSPFEKDMIASQISEINRQVSIPQWQRTTSSMVAGLSDMYMEKLGSLSYVNKFTRIAPVAGASTFKKMMYSGLNTGLNLSKEIGEEMGVELINNASDIVMLGEDKSLLDGINKDFIVNTAFTSLAIQGPGMGGNAYNIIRDEVQTVKDRTKTLQRRNELFNIRKKLNDTGNPITVKERKKLVARQRAIIRAESMQDVMKTQKLARMSDTEVKSLFNLNAKKRKLLKDIRSNAAQGMSKATKKNRDKLVAEYKKVDARRNDLLSREARKRQEAAKDNSDPAQLEHNMGLNDFYTDVVEMNQAMNDGGFTKYEGENKPDVESLKRRGLSDADAKAVVAAYDKGSNAANIGNDIFIFQENINQGMANTDLITESEIAAVAPMHELLHIQNRKAGIVKDNVVVGQANTAITELDGLMKEKLALNKITQEQYDNFNARKKLYTTDKGVNVEELLNLYGDFVNIGVLTASGLNNMYGIKNTLSTLVNKFNPSNQAWLFPMQTGKDVFGYLNSFQKSAKKYDIARIDDDEKKEEVKESSSLAEMSKDFDMSKPSGRTRFLNENLAKDKDGNFVTDITRSKFGQDIGGMIESTTRRLYDKVPEDLRKGVTRDDFKNDLTTMASTLIQQEFDPSKQDLDKFLSNRLNLRANKLATDTFDQEFTDDITEAKDIAAEETADIVKEDNKKIDQSQRGIKLANRLVTNEDQKETLDQAVQEIKSEIDNLPIADLDFKTLKNIAIDKVQELFGIKPKAGNLTKGDVANAQNFINKNVEALMTMMPEGATRSGTSTGVQKVLLDKLYKKTKRVAMSVTGSKAGLAVQEKRNDITQSQFKEIFGITPAGTPNISDRNTSARIKALVAQTERMLSNQEVRAELEKRGRDIPQALAEGKAQVMFSESLNKVTPEQRKLYDKLSNARSINDVAKILGLPKITVNDENRIGKQIAILEAIEKYGLSSNVFKAAMPASSGAIRMRVGKVPMLDMYLADNNIKAVKGDVWYKLTNGKFAKGVEKGVDKNGNKTFSPPVDKEGLPLTNLVAQRGRLYYGVTDPAYITALTAAEARDDKQKPKRIRVKGKITRKEFNKNKPQSDMNMDILEDVSKQLGNAVKEGMNPALAALLIAQGYQATAGLIKIAARFDNVSDVMEYGKSKKQRTGEKYREEHNPPASVIGATLIGAIVNKNVDEIFPFIRKNYSQTQLSKASDELLDMAKLDATIPTGYSIFNDPLIRLAMAGINGNTITNLTSGKSMMEDYGLPVPGRLKNNTAVVAFQNNLVAEVENGKSIEDAKAELDAFLPLASDIQKSANENVSMLNESKVLNVDDNMSPEDILSKAKTIDEALANARKTKKTNKKIRVFDFDDTLAQTNSIVFYTKKDGSQGELTAEQFASDGARLVQEGAVMDFSDFDIVRDGKRGPLFKVAETIKNARGNEDLYVLTARSPQAQEAIYEFLKSEGLEFKKENIVGLGNSSGEAKANWIIDKAAEGFNDFYFADDAYQNVKAVQDALDVIDVKSQVQQAHVLESKNLNSDFNKLLENTTGIGKQKKYSKAKAQVRGANKGKGKFWIPYSAEDFQGLIYKTLAKGALGDAQMAWYKQHVLDPYARAMDNFSTARLNLMKDFNALKKKLNVPANLRKKTDSGFTNEQAVRVYLWNKTGQKVPGLSDTDLKELSDIVENDPQLKVFADQILTITKGDGYGKPGQSWLVGTITTDLLDLLNTTKRDKFLEQWQNNVDQIYNQDNLNKLEAIYGAKYREALENVLSRMKSGKNRLSSGNRLSNKILDYINASNGAIMFFNMRSAVLQTISSINFMNWSFNNPIQAGKAFANQPQYWSDFKKLMNSDFLMDRRNGLRINISESEIADAAKTSQNKAKAVLNYILQKGYLPTQYADSFAIASGGATFYRNRINSLVKDGMKLKDAEAQAMQEFREIAEENQQSSRPDKISQQQASDAGRLILMFANTPMQYARIQKRAFQDLVNGRGDRKTNISKIIYYGVIQNIIFNALQQAVFALGFGDGDDDEEEKNKKYLKTANGMLDSTLRGLGMGGTAVSVIKNFIYDIYERSGRSRPEYVDSVWKLLQFSPPISSKISRMRQALWLFDSKKRRKEMFDKGFSLDNPAYDAAAKVISATTNLPLDRVLQKFDNINSAMNEETEWWQSVAMLLGWPSWSLEEKTSSTKTTKKKKPKLTSRQKSRNKKKRKVTVRKRP